MTVHLIYANVLITAQNSYYAMDAVPEFWEWLEFQAGDGRLKIPAECYDEILAGNSVRGEDQLCDWLKTDGVKQAILFAEEVDGTLARHVLEQGYAPDLNDVEIEQIGQDPFLIAHALKSPGGRIVVTAETSAPSKRRQNRKIPDICGDLGITCIHPFQLYRALNFSTRWRSS